MYPTTLSSLRVFLFAALALCAATLRAAEAGSISGNVNNSASGNMLEGVRVTIPSLGLTALTDNTGRYVFPSVPPGAHEISASYIGLDTQKVSVNITTGQRAVRDFEMTSGIYQLTAFKVTGEREGGAAAITEKRNADNVKDVVAMDSFGNLPNMSAGEVVMRLPGVAGSPTDEGLNYKFNMRGMGPELNTVTVDGGLLPSLGASRAFEMQSITGTMFEALELIKGHTPDKGADSLGGTVNLKTRSPLSMREKRRTNYSFTTRVAPSFLEQTPLREDHRAHPLVTLSHQEVFDIFGGHKNLGIALNIFYSENAVGGAAVLMDYQNTMAPSAYIWNYATWENINNRKQMSLSLKTDYRWSPSTKFSVTLTGNDNFERHRRRIQMRAFTGSATVVPANNTGIVQGAHSDKITVVRPITTVATPGFPAASAANSSNIDMLMDGPLNYYVRMRRIDLGGEHDLGRLKMEYMAGYSQSHLNNGQGTAGQLTMRVPGVGWIIDRTHSDTEPSFVQNGGPDMYNPNNYRPTANGLTNTNNQSDQRLKQLRYDATYQMPTERQLFFKAGFSWREQMVGLEGNDNHRWSYVGTGPLEPDTQFVSWEETKTGRDFPRWQSHTFMNDRKPRNPALWSEDLYYYESQKYISTRSATETASALYMMARGRLGTEGLLGRTGYLTGVRWEKTEVESWGWRRNRVIATAAQQVAAPLFYAQRDYADNYIEYDGGYDKAFPSAHLFHDITPNLKIRGSFSTSFGRAPISNFFPSIAINETTRIVTINNASLRPQTAKNWDITGEYYFEPVGSFTVGWFHKRIKDFIITDQYLRDIEATPDNGYNGDYGGFTERTTVNAPSVVTEGWEFGYQQQFTFLPGLLKGTAFSANYTWIDTHGLYEPGVYMNKKQVQTFIPYVANLTLSWRYAKFSARVLYNFTGEYTTDYDANPALNLYRESFKTVNVGISYQVKPSLRFSFDVANLLNEPQVFFRGFKGRTQRTIMNFVTLTVGVNGQF
ncbi:MAG: TonB-dependent receptor [Verrucomicrobiota bacterium]